MPRILAISGSLRSQSYNRHLAAAMAAGASAAGAETEVLDWAEFPLPLLSEDLEASGVPDVARAFKAKLRAADALIITCPEYNGGYSGVIKNAIDWASRSWPDDAAGSVYKNKPVVIAGATIGRWGCVRAIRQLREVLGYLGCIVLPDSVSVSEAGRAFDGNGNLLDDKLQQAAAAAGAALARATTALSA
jgi:NAD(P)H-dependent FMN reductase